MGSLLRLLTCCLTFALTAKTQDISIRILSEFQRIGPLGEVVEADRAIAPREVISPAVARNGFASFHVAVTAPPGTIYFLAAQTQPSNAVTVRIYKEEWVRTPIEWVPDKLSGPVNLHFFVGVMPDYQAPDPSKSTEVYLLDIWIPGSLPAGLVRVEVLVKTADWKVAPMELRLMRAKVPDLRDRFCCEAVPGAGEPADTSAWTEVLAALSGHIKYTVPEPLTVRSVLLRNARQDAALVGIMSPPDRRNIENRAWFAALARWPYGAESYLPVRNAILQSFR